MTTINSQEDFLRALSENPEWRAAVRAQILGEDVLQMPAKFDAFVEEQREFNASLTASIEELKEINRAQRDINDRLARNMDRIAHDIGQLRGWFARLNAADFGPVIAMDMGMEFVRNLTRAELVQMAGQAVRSGIPRDSLRSFYNADVIIEATQADASTCYIAVEASYTADHRDADRALRNVEFLTQFTGLPAYPCIVSVRNDRELGPDVLQGNVFWYPIPERTELEIRLIERQSGKCYICDESIDLEIHKGSMDIDHIDPFSEGGPDTGNNFALTHLSCNRSKGASDIRVARRLAELDKLHQQARDSGSRGANLSHILVKYGGGKARLRIRRENDRVDFSFPETGDNRVQSASLHKDSLSDAEYFFAVVPLEYIHHDDRINPRDIGTNVRKLIEEFLRGRPQLHVGLAWWAPEKDGAGELKLFDGQHKAAAQIMLGAKQLPVRVFVEPDINLLITTNTNAGSDLRQVAFDTSTMRRLGSTLYADRAAQYRKMRELPDGDLSFSEHDLVRHFRGERRQMEKYIIDAQRDSITYNSDNRLTEFVEMGGRGTNRPLAYSTVESAFFQLLYKKALDTSIDENLEAGSNPRDLERTQMVRLMNIFADVFFVGKWDPDVGGNRIENRVSRGDEIPENHLRAWRVARDEVAVNIIRHVRLVIENYFAFNGVMVDKERLLHVNLPDDLWQRVENFLTRLSELRCWLDKDLSQSVFGPKQNLDYWESVFKTGQSPDGTRVLAQGLNILEMI